MNKKNEWHGGMMFWSHYGREKNLELLKKGGFEIISEKPWNPSDDPNDRHLFVLCRKLENETQLLKNAVDFEIEQIRSGKIKTKPFRKIKKRYNL